MTSTQKELLEHAICSTSNFRVHPLGFYFFTQQADAELVQRIHVWVLPTDGLLTNDMHAHSYDIESSVVLGKLRNELLEFSEDAGGSILEFSVSYRGQKSVLELTGRRGKIRTLGTFDTGPGNRYCLQAGQIHRALAKNMPCVTILNTRDRGHPILTYGSNHPTQPFPRRDVLPEETEAIKIALIEAIQLVGDN